MPGFDIEFETPMGKDLHLLRYAPQDDTLCLLSLPSSGSWYLHLRATSHRHIIPAVVTIRYLKTHIRAEPCCCLGSSANCGPSENGETHRHASLVLFPGCW
jgi:hypothetical protein